MTLRNAGMNKKGKVRRTIGRVTEYMLLLKPLRERLIFPGTCICGLREYGKNKKEKEIVLKFTNLEKIYFFLTKTWENHRLNKNILYMIYIYK